MKVNTILKLNQINKNFYQDNSQVFDQTRQFFWSGWQKLLPLLKKQFRNKKIKVLDLGCGNGRFGLWLKNKVFDFNYWGIDQNEVLLNLAKQRLTKEGVSGQFILLDLVDKLVQKKSLFEFTQQFDLIVLFGFWHHCPAQELRINLLFSLKKYLAKDGLLVISFWQFANDIKLINREQKNIIQLGLNDDALEKNDYLLTWERGKKSYRYGHFSNLEEITLLAIKTQLQIGNFFYDDGKNQHMNLYCVFSLIN